MKEEFFDASQAEGLDAQRQPKRHQAESGLDIVVSERVREVFTDLLQSTIDFSQVPDDSCWFNSMEKESKVMKRYISQEVGANRIQLIQN